MPQRVAIGLAIGLLGASPAAVGGTKEGPSIDQIDWNAATYRPGDHPTMTVTVGRLEDGESISATLWNGDGMAMPSPPPRKLNRSDALIRFAFDIPPTDFRGYHVTVAVRAGDGSLLAEASGAFDVATDWKRFPRYCFMTGSSVVAGAPIRAVVDRLGSYRCNAIQWYDVNWKHHQPYSPARSWPNVSGQRIDRATLEAGLGRAHSLGMMNFDYELWNGAWSGYATDGSGAKPAWGLYRQRCVPHCTEQEQISHGPFPAGWATPRLFQMDAGNSHWKAYWIGREREVLRHFAYDGVQIDTLGDPGQATTDQGVPVDLRRAMLPFVDDARTALRTRVVFNLVSQWGLDELLAGDPGDVVYTELHPEFGNVPFLPALNGLATVIRARSDRAIVIAAYDEAGRAKQAGCRTAGGHRTCFFGSAGVRYLDAQSMASGLDHWEFGDLNRDCPVPQAKLASNIYIPGPALCMDAKLAEWEHDARNFAVSYETLLRDGVADAPALDATVSGLPTGVVATRTGAAGSIYVLPKRAGDATVLHLLNYAALASIRIDDPNGDDPAPRQLHGLSVSLPVAAACTPRMWWASPDFQHGQAQPLTYRRAGNRLVATIPVLDVWDMLVVDPGTTKGCGRTG